MYHINNKTGNPGVCRAKVKCPYGDLVDEHYSDRETALLAAELVNNTNVDTDALVNYVEKAGTYETDVDFNLNNWLVEQLKENEKPWTGDEVFNLKVLEKIIDAQQVTPVDKEKLKRLGAMLRKSRRNLRWYDRDRQEDIFLMGKNLVFRGGYESNAGELAVPRELNAGLAINRNELTNDVWKLINEYNYYGNVTPAEVENALNRFEAGERLELEEEIYNDSLAPEDRVLRLLSDETRGEYQRAYLMLAFKDRELKDAMKRLGVTGVKVDVFANGREQGLVYTVGQPGVGTRSFAVYEHRNSDSIIINGKTNWSKDEELPYAADSKNAFFAEVISGDYKQAARSLTYFMREAQRGELPRDTDVAANADKLDWNAILSEKIPGFAAWLKKQKDD